MRSLKYKSDSDPTSEAHAIMLELEAQLGVSLHVKDAGHPNDVHGWVETDCDGNVAVHLYDQADVNRINAMPKGFTPTTGPRKGIRQEIKAYDGIFKRHPISDADFQAGVEVVLSKRGVTKVVQ